VSTEHFFLQWPACPVSKGGIFGVEHAFIEESDHGVDGHLGGFIAVAHRGSIFERGGNHFAQSGAEGLSIFNALHRKACAQNDGKYFLKSEREIICSHL
jgi:hypothetical protein